MCQHSHTQTHNKGANRFSTEREKQRRVLPLPLRGEPPSTEGLSSLPAVINTSPLSEVDDKQLLINHRLGALGSGWLVEAEMEVGCAVFKAGHF